MRVQEAENFRFAIVNGKAYTIAAHLVGDLSARNAFGGHLRSGAKRHAIRLLGLVIQQLPLQLVFLLSASMHQCHDFRDESKMAHNGVRQKGGVQRAESSKRVAQCPPRHHRSAAPPPARRPVFNTVPYY